MVYNIFFSPLNPQSFKPYVSGLPSLRSSPIWDRPPPVASEAKKARYSATREASAGGDQLMSPAVDREGNGLIEWADSSTELKKHI